MSDARKPLPRSIRGGRPFFFADPATDKVLNMVVTLASEVWALRERLAAVEGAKVRRNALAAGEVDGYEFSEAEESRLGADRREFIENLFRILQEQVDSATSRSPSARDKAAARPGVFGARVAAVGRGNSPRRPARAAKRPPARAPAKKSRPKP